MIILAGDTSTSINTVALCEDGKVLGETIVDCGRTHAERLLDTVSWLLNETGLTLDQIDALAVSIGPGSFTGLRVGIATWKGLALGRSLPLIGVPALAALSRIPGTVDGLLCPIVDARMGEVFAAAFRFNAGRREQVLAECVCPVEAVAQKLEGMQVTLLGDGVGAYAERIEACFQEAHVLPQSFWAPRASAVAAEGFEMLQAGCRVEAAAIRPVYLRKSQAEQNRQRLDGT